MLSGWLPALFLPISGLQLPQPQHLHHLLLQEKWVRDSEMKEWLVESLYFQTQPRSDLRRLHIRDGGQESDPGNIQLPGRISFSQAGSQANHQSRLLHINVTSLHLKHEKNIKLIFQCRLQLYIFRPWFSVRVSGVHGGSLSRARLHLCLHDCQWDGSEVVSKWGAGIDCQYCIQVSNLVLLTRASPTFSSGYGFGSSIWIPLETAFINPANIKPESPNCLVSNSTEVECSDKYFIDEDLLKRSASFSSYVIPHNLKLGFRTVSSYWLAW